MESVSSFQNDQSFSSSVSPTSPSETQNPYRSIDILFDKLKDKSLWEPIKPPQPLGELLDSRYMIPLLFPTDPRMLGAFSKHLNFTQIVDVNGSKMQSDDTVSSRQSFESQRSSRSGRSPDVADGVMSCRWRNKKIREVRMGTLQKIDGTAAAARWGKIVEHRFMDDDSEDTEGIIKSFNGNGAINGASVSVGGGNLHPSYSVDDLLEIAENETIKISVATQLTPFTRKLPQRANSAYGQDIKRVRQCDVIPAEKRQPGELQG